ncbi:hypothetical protein, partial [Heyndrickxia coagulans]|uniref:hypothetical protein n=1 Tax=Heyndrickxia coagulans TaxID=1398 RepID=UPI00214D299E
LCSLLPATNEAIISSSANSAKVRRRSSGTVPAGASGEWATRIAALRVEDTRKDAATLRICMIRKI